MIELHLLTNRTLGNNVWSIRADFLAVCYLLFLTSCAQLQPHTNEPDSVHTNVPPSASELFFCVDIDDTDQDGYFNTTEIYDIKPDFDSFDTQFCVVCNLRQLENIEVNLRYWDARNTLVKLSKHIPQSANSVWLEKHQLASWIELYGTGKFRVELVGQGLVLVQRDLIIIK